MFARSAILVLAGLISLGALSTTAEAAPPQDTVVTFGEMCGGCVKRINARLTTMPEIADVKCDVATKSATVTPGASGVSPRILWEALEEIGKKPVKMVGPTGTFTTKPAK
jgi:periplasmic mercuric ion binding protein